MPLPPSAAWCATVQSPPAPPRSPLRWSVLWLGLEMARGEHVFQPGEGLVKDNVEDTIRSVGRMGRDGMKETDIEILNIMLGK